MENKENIFCPICKELPMRPRIYDCGHTICEKCMIQTDEIDKNKILSVFRLPHYNCPICREKTLKPWFYRPINRALLSLLLDNKEYKKDFENYSNDFDEKDYLENIPSHLDLSIVCEQSRLKIAMDMYDMLIPLLFDAAIKGKPYISINTDVVRKLKTVIDLVSDKLFENHNIYKVTCSYRDCTIEFIKCQENNLIKSEYINDDYISPNTNLSLIENDSDD